MIVVSEVMFVYVLEMDVEVFVFVFECLQQLVVVQLDKLVVYDEIGMFIWCQFVDNVNCVVNCLCVVGLQCGEIVVGLFENSVCYLILFMGIFIVGGCMVLLFGMVVGEILVLMVNDCDVCFLFVFVKYCDLIELLLGGFDNIDYDICISLDFQVDGWLVFEDWLGELVIDVLDYILLLDDLFNIIYSFGIIGVFKGIFYDYCLCVC